mmetsp:Transcript_15335/g.31157  ORF Transcript_15335/g.31157 Transcript_15335/m.31157 type:complete len:124 (+) Transcript_15335:18-389(+)
MMAISIQLSRVSVRITNGYKAREDEYAILKSFAHALSTNSNLKQLTLDGIRWEEQTKILLRAIYDDSSLNTLAMSNHVCQFFIDDGNINPTFKSISEDYKWIQGTGRRICDSQIICSCTLYEF